MSCTLGLRETELSGPENTTINQAASQTANRGSQSHSQAAANQLVISVQNFIPDQAPSRTAGSGQAGLARPGQARASQPATRPPSQPASHPATQSARHQPRQPPHSMTGWMLKMRFESENIEDRRIPKLCSNPRLRASNPKLRIRNWT